MDPPPTQKVEPDRIPHQVTPPHRQILHLMFHQTQLQPLKPSQQTGWKLFFRCRNWSILQMHIKTFIKWQSTTAWNRSLHSCQRIIIQTCNGFWTEIPCPCHLQFLEIYSSSGSPQQARASREHLYIHPHKRQYYWKGINKDIWKYIVNCTLCCREKAKIQNYPLQMMEIPDRPFDKIAIDLITDCKTSTSGNKHILTIIDYLTGWPEAFPIPDKTADTIVSTFINE